MYICFLRDTLSSHYAYRHGLADPSSLCTYVNKGEGTCTYSMNDPSRISGSKTSHFHWSDAIYVFSFKQRNRCQA